ncbi:hypothetical protein G9A89_023633 [Geosiphon pyriformis]|nr:hypothetical protein G9A89_023633 [Geosiphon pyriformis]
MTEDIRKMEITNNIHSLVQQFFQLIQQQEIEITINQQTIKYTNTRKRPQDKVQRKTENTIDKIVAKVKLNKITPIIFEKEVQKLLKNGELELGDLGDLDRAQY